MGKHAVNRTRQQRKHYRAALRERGLVRTDRFTDMMLAVTGDGSHPCACCRVVRPLKAMDEARICTVCRKRMSRLTLGGLPEPRQPTRTVEPNVVWTDASFADGIAGLAVVGALGDHSRQVEAVSSSQAETLALRWAMEIARAAGRKGLTFRTDCQAAWKVLRQTPKREHWTVEQIPRSRNYHADALAGRARRFAPPLSTGEVA